MWYYKKKAAQDSYAPRSNCQTVLIEACLSSTEGKTAGQIHQELNMQNAGVTLARLKQHLNCHVETGRLEREERNIG
jgi:hypothetical protein